MTQNASKNRKLCMMENRHNACTQEAEISNSRLAWTTQPRLKKTSETGGGEGRGEGGKEGGEERKGQRDRGQQIPRDAY